MTSWLELNRFQSERQHRFNTLVRRDSVCTLLIPAALGFKLKSHLISKRISMGAYLGELLAKNRPRLTGEAWPVFSTCFRHYQSPGQSLRRQNFRVESAVWYELGLFAAFFGVSCCFLFVKLIEMDLDGYPDAIGGVPTGRLEVYDQFFPDYIETRIRIIRGRTIERNVLQIPKDEMDLPLRFFPFPYPEGFLQVWLRRNLPGN